MKGCTQAQVFNKLVVEKKALQTLNAHDSVLPQAKILPELVLTQALPELVLEPLNKALQEENGRLKTEVEVLKDREVSKNKEIHWKHELVDEYKARSKSVEGEYGRAKDENQKLKDEVSSLKEKEIRLTVENEFLRRRDEEIRLERNAERVMFQTIMSNLICGIEDRKRKRNDNEETK
jgi:predicted RNase H-like nuclease (RuvC/YqgF family)